MANTPARDGETLSDERDALRLALAGQQGDERFIACVLRPGFHDVL